MRKQFQLKRRTFGRTSRTSGMEKPGTKREIALYASFLADGPFVPGIALGMAHWLLTSKASFLRDTAPGWSWTRSGPVLVTLNN